MAVGVLAVFFTGWLCVSGFIKKVHRDSRGRFIEKMRLGVNITLLPPMFQKIECVAFEKYAILCQQKPKVRFYLGETQKKRGSHLSVAIVFGRLGTVFVYKTRQIFIFFGRANLS